MELTCQTVGRFLRIMAKTMWICIRVCPFEVFLDVNRHYQARCAKYWNFCTIETTASIATKFCTTKKTTKWSKCTPVKSKMADGRHIEQESLANAKVNVRQHWHVRWPLSLVWRPISPERNPCEYLHNPYVARTYIYQTTFLPLTVWVYLHLFSCGSLQTREILREFDLTAVQGHRSWC